MAGLQTLGHEQAERVRLVTAERRAILIAEGAIEGDRLRLPDSSLETDAPDLPLPCSLLQRREQAPAKARSPRLLTHEQPLHLGVPGSDEAKCDRSEKLAIAPRDEKHGTGRGKRFRIHQVIAFGGIERLQHGVRFRNQAFHIRLPRVFGRDADLRRAHPGSRQNLLRAANAAPNSPRCLTRIKMNTLAASVIEIAACDRTYRRTNP